MLHLFFAHTKRSGEVLQTSSIKGWTCRSTDKLDLLVETARQLRVVLPLKIYGFRKFIHIHKKKRQRVPIRVYFFNFEIRNWLRIC